MKRKLLSVLLIISMLVSMFAVGMGTLTASAASNAGPYFDVNHDGIGVNLFGPTRTNSSIKGINFSYDSATGIITVNGSTTQDILSHDDYFDEIHFTAQSGEIYRVSASHVSGSMSNGCFVVDAFGSNGYDIGDSSNAGARLYFDFTGGNTQKTWVFNGSQANHTASLRIWSWRSGGTLSFDNLKFKLKIERVSSESSSATEMSPPAKNLWDNIMPYPERSGYSFDGWYSQPSGGTRIMHGDMTNYANQTV